MPPVLRTRRLYLNRLDASADISGVVVVIDVLRSFSTAAYAFAAGARVIYPVETVAAALQLAQQHPNALTTGAIAGGDPVSGFDFGNSPAALFESDLRNRTLIQTTAAGVRGLLRFAHAEAVFAAGLVCASATAQAILALAPATVTLLITGEWVDRDGDEDAACADYIEALLQGKTPDPAQYAARVRQSDFGRRFARGDNPSLPLADLALCAQADRFDFAIRAVRNADRLALEARHPPAWVSPTLGEKQSGQQSLTPP